MYNNIAHIATIIVLIVCRMRKFTKKSAHVYIQYLLFERFHRNFTYPGRLIIDDYTET